MLTVTEPQQVLTFLLALAAFLTAVRNAYKHYKLVRPLKMRGLTLDDVLNAVRLASVDEKEKKS